MNSTTELVFLLDRSGSMAGLVSDTIGGFNAMLEKQKRESGEVLVTTVLFDTRTECLHDRLPLSRVAPLSERDYTPGGCTALLDALGSTIHHIAGIHRYARPEDVPARTLFVITTDGLENASHHYNYDQVRRMVEHQKHLCDWEFLFLGANMDAIQAGRRFGIAPNRAVTFENDSEGIGLNYDVLSQTIAHVRASACPSAGAAMAEPNYHWSDRIEEDYKKRHRKIR